MNGPAPSMFVMLSAVAGSSPKWRVSWELAGAFMARQYYAMTNGVVSEQVYAGFWLRLAAAIIDSLLLLAIILPIELAVYGREYLDATKLIYGPVDFIVSWVFPVVATILFWIYRAATPGKIWLKLRIADARTGQPPSLQQSIVRYFGYFLSIIPLFLGFLWIAWDPRKQGFHDKLAGTVVLVRPRAAQSPPVQSAPPTHA
jgi:uncharacterized RDD family membrane protein YckC